MSGRHIELDMILRYAPPQQSPCYDPMQELRIMCIDSPEEEVEVVTTHVSSIASPPQPSGTTGNNRVAVKKDQVTISTRNAQYPDQTIINKGLHPPRKLPFENRRKTQHGAHCMRMQEDTSLGCGARREQTRMIYLSIRMFRDAHMGELVGRMHICSQYSTALYARILN